MMAAKHILIVHNYYQQPGGEETVFRAETELLRRYGHQVTTYVEDNKRIDQLSAPRAANEMIWSRSTQQKLSELLDAAQPDLVHFHNTFLLISPAAYYTCQEAGVPVVQTLHNYRIFCPAANFFRNGHVCESCLGHTPPWPGMVHGCYRSSRVQTTAVSTMLTLHHYLQTWQTQIDRYIALSEFSRSKFIEGGLPQDKIIVKPNFAYPDPERRIENEGLYALFVGRLSEEKGILPLLQSWLRTPEIPLQIVGDGHLKDAVHAFVEAQQLHNVHLHGQLPHSQVLELIKQARFIIVPSQCYENFPMSIVEAFACGVPVIASRLGAMAEIIQEGHTGLTFSPTEPADLAAKVEWAWAHSLSLKQMGYNARTVYEQKYSAEKNYQMLMDIYTEASNGRSL